MVCCVGMGGSVVMYGERLVGVCPVEQWGGVGVILVAAVLCCCVMIRTYTHLLELVP